MSASNGYANSGADVQYVIGFTVFSGNVCTYYSTFDGFD